MLNSNYLTPKQIVEELDKYIVGQGEAKRNVAIALRNRWRRMNAPLEPGALFTLMFLLAMARLLERMSLSIPELKYIQIPELVIVASFMQMRSSVAMDLDTGPMSKAIILKSIM